MLKITFLVCKNPSIQYLLPTNVEGRGCFADHVLLHTKCLIIQHTHTQSVLFFKGARFRHLTYRSCFVLQVTVISSFVFPSLPPRPLNVFFAVCILLACGSAIVLVNPSFIPPEESQHLSRLCCRTTDAADFILLTFYFVIAMFLHTFVFFYRFFVSFCS